MDIKLENLKAGNDVEFMCYLCYIKNKERELIGCEQTDTFLTATVLGRVGRALELRNGLYKLFFLSCMKQQIPKIQIVEKEVIVEDLSEIVPEPESKQSFTKRSFFLKSKS